MHDDEEDRLVASVAKILMPYLYPDWPPRWGWGALSHFRKMKCMEAANKVIDEVYKDIYGQRKERQKA